MYAFTISLYVIGVRHVDLILHLMAQPPWDSKMTMGHNKSYYICHYTYGNDYSEDGRHTPGRCSAAQCKSMVQNWLAGQMPAWYICHGIYRLHTDVRLPWTAR
eukprot:GHRR01025042.1.p1 GENE.GHRR01025042.1~~GHRR01025042.1.p1  ORF type:complete len:103 (-),score=17.58 GHRR01025042.1:269-577(-)